MTIQELNLKIDRLFSEEGVKDLCFELNIDFDNLPGETKKDIVRELVLYCERTGQLEALVNVCAIERPNESWAVPAPRRSFGSFIRGTGAGSQPFHMRYLLPIVAVLVVLVATISLIAGYIIRPRLAQEAARTEQATTEAADAITTGLTQTRERLSVMQTADAEELLTALATTPTLAAEVIETRRVESINTPETSSEATLTELPTATPTNLPEPASTSTPLSPLTETLDGPPANPDMGDEWQRAIDGMTMVYVPQGTFDMGNDSGMPDESPVHEVWLSSYWIDQTEVTNGQFSRFLNEVGNQQITSDPPGAEEGLSEQYEKDVRAGTESDRWFQVDDSDALIELSVDGDFVSKADKENHPVVEVSWYGAAAYCEWVGGKLPSEAQWEYAARGRDEFLFPWGNNFNDQALNCWSLAGLENPPACVDSYSKTSPVGIFDNGSSWVGAWDMAGNVFEWTNDWYSDQYYSEVGDSVMNPQGPDSGLFKVTRGGSWDMSRDDVRSTERTAGRANPRSFDATYPHRTNDDTGFRCVIKAN